MPKNHTPLLRKCAVCGKRKKPRYFDRSADHPGYNRVCRSCVMHKKAFSWRTYEKEKEKRLKKFGVVHIPVFICASREDLEVKACLYALKNGLRFTDRQWNRFLNAIEEKAHI